MEADLEVEVMQEVGTVGAEFEVAVME